MCRVKINIETEYPGCAAPPYFLPLPCEPEVPFDMVPDYPHKLFCDQRIRYCLLMEVLAID
jgi:hypothetical protein